MELLDARFEAVQRDARIENLEKKLRWYEEKSSQLKKESEAVFPEYDKKMNKKINRYHLEREFLRRCNETLEPITPETIAHIKQIGKEQWRHHEQWEPFLTADEVENLTIPQGTLTEKEREIIDNHVVITRRMLDQLPYPKSLRMVPEIAGDHHEWVNGKGYPRGLKKDQMPIRARILAIADVFEALAAPDRAYKKPLRLSEILRKMRGMVDEGHLDSDLFDVFLKNKVYLTYAKEYMAPEQIDLD